MVRKRKERRKEAIGFEIPVTRGAFDRMGIKGLVGAVTLWHGSPALRSFIYVDVGEPTSHPCSITRTRQDHHLPALQDFKSLGTSMRNLL